MSTEGIAYNRTTISRGVSLGRQAESYNAIIYIPLRNYRAIEVDIASPDWTNIILDSLASAKRIVHVKRHGPAAFKDRARAPTALLSNQRAQPCSFVVSQRQYPCAGDDIIPACPCVCHPLAFFFFIDSMANGLFLTMLW